MAITQADFDDINELLSLTQQASLTNSEQDLISALYSDGSLPCFKWLAFTDIIKTRQAKSECVQLNLDIVNRLADKDGCLAAVAGLENKDNSNFIADITSGGSGCGCGC
jgi:hypothetical protein